MATTSYILFPHGPTWQIASVTGGHATFADMLPPEGDAAPQTIAPRLAEELRRLGYTGQGVLLALASADCLAAPIDTVGLPRGDRKALLYRLEEKLPVAAEAVVADFALAPGHALGVCVREDAVAPLLHSLESCGVAVQSISPTTLLAARQLAEDGGNQILLIGEDDGLHVNVISIRDGLPTSWSLLPARAADLKLHLDLLAMDSTDDAPPLRACGVEPGLLTGLATQSIPAPPRQVAAIAAAASLEGRKPVWIEFRRGALAISDRLRLHRKALDALLTAVAILLVCLTAGLLVRAHRYHAAAQTAQRQMADEFTATFPGSSLPSNIRTIVESEKRKLGSPGANAIPADATGSALQTLHAALSTLPADLKFKMDHLDFFDNRFELGGRVRTLGDIDALASASRQTGFDVKSADAHLSEGFWSFTLVGTRRPRSTAAPSVRTPPESTGGANLQSNSTLTRRP